MRVANIIEEGRLGGPQVRICAVAEALKGSVETTVIMPNDNADAFQGRCDENGVSYIKLPLTRITKEWRVAFRYVFFSFFEVLWLAHALNKGAFDLVHVSGGSWQFKGVLAAKLAGKKVLWHLNDTSMPGFVRRMFSVISRLVDGFIFSSESSRQYYGPLIRQIRPVFVIPAPVDTATFDPDGEYVGDSELLKKWRDKIVVGMTANINPVKGIETFIRAIPIVNGKVNDAHFVVVGPVFKNQQRYFRRLKGLCDALGVQNVEFVGGRSDVKPILKRFDVYACSSRSESSPIAVWEAMAMGKPIVSTDVGDVSLYAKDGDSSFIVNVDDSDAMADRIFRLATDSDKRQKFGARARDVAVRELDLKHCAALHLEAYLYTLNHIP